MPLTHLHSLVEGVNNEALGPLQPLSTMTYIGVHALVLRGAIVLDARKGRVVFYSIYITSLSISPQWPRGLQAIF